MRRDTIIVNGWGLTPPQIETIKEALLNLSVDLNEHLLYNNVIEEQNKIDQYQIRIKEIQRMLE